MLKLAIDSMLPLITVYTDDTVNVGAILTAVRGGPAPVRSYSPTLRGPMVSMEVYYMVDDSSAIDYKKLYSAFSNKKASLIIVNPKESNSAAFDAGVLTTPPKMVERFVSKYGGGEHHEGLLAALAGLSYEQVYQISKMAMTKHGEYTPKAVLDIRKEFFGTVRGLQMLSTDFLYYAPPVALQDWLSSSGRFLRQFQVPLLTPRGLLFNGPPGTGKTMGAKYLARTLDLPLYHLDVGSLMEKYVGESERNLKIALQQAEASAPCVMLIDEVEKLFSTGSDDSGVISRMLSSILWWLQEHRASVLTVMTTNKWESIPPELIRPGRVDKVLYFGRLNVKAAEGFYRSMAKHMWDKYTLPIHDSCNRNFKDYEKGAKFSHAEVAALVLEDIKDSYIESAT
jgi:hypothetical protein